MRNYAKVFLKYIAYRLLPTKTYLQLYYFRVFGRFTNFKRPNTLNEKLQWKKLYGHSPLHTTITDKYSVREYITKRIGKDYLIPLVTVLDDPDRFELANLPQSFVAKVNHGSGQNRIVRDKCQVDELEIRRCLKRWFSNNHYYESKEPQYRDIKPRIIVEELLTDDDGKIPLDYKLHCFNGRVEAIQVDIDRFGDHRRNFYSKDWNLLPFTWSQWDKYGPKWENGSAIEKPRELAKMIDIAGTLSQPFDYIRVDLYCLRNRIYFGELTLNHGGGWERFDPPEYDKIFGDKLILSPLGQGRLENVAVALPVSAGTKRQSGVSKVLINKRICVVLVVDDLEYGGAQRQVIELANNMDQDRFYVHVCTLSDYVPLGSQLRDSERKLHTVAKKNKVDFTVVPRLARLLKSLNADIVHSYLFSANIASRLAGRLARTDLIIGSERLANYSPKKRHVFAYRLTRGCVDLTIANSKAGADFNSRMFGQPASKYRIVYNGVDTARFRPRDRNIIRNELGIPSEKRVIGVFASYKPQKNHPMLLHAFKRVLDLTPDTQLLVVGDQLAGNIQWFGHTSGTDDYHAKMEALIDELGIRHRCTSLGNRNDVERIYPACDITALSSLYEGTPNVLLESMACGVPVVATNVSDNAYVVKDGVTGFLVELGDVEGMAGRIQVLLGNEALRQEMGKKANDWVMEEFSIKQLVRKTESVYLEALNGKRSKCR